MFKEFRRRHNVAALGGHTARLASLKEIRDQYDQEGRKDMVLVFNFELASEATRALLVVRKLQELGGVFESPDDASKMRAALEYYSQLPGVPRHSVKFTPPSEIDRLYSSFVVGKVSDPERKAPRPSEGTESPCELCRLGQWVRHHSGVPVLDPNHEGAPGAQEWMRDHSAVAQWRFEGPSSNNSLTICMSCRKFLIEADLLRGNPMLALAVLVAQGRSHRPAPWDFLLHPTWQHVWQQIVSSKGHTLTDLSAGARIVAPIAEEFYRRAGYRPNVDKVPRLDKQGRIDVGPVLHKLMKDYGIPFEVIERKYLTYCLTLQSLNQSSNWNADIDDDALRSKALSHKEVQSARLDLHKAILNRVKLALFTEGFTPLP